MVASDVYSPAEDSFFLSEFLKNYLSRLEDKDIRYLDMGCGSAILSETASAFLDVARIVAADKNPDAVACAERKGFCGVQTDLFSNIGAKFDLITFNAPYLPGDTREPESSSVATTGGKKGDEISVQFLQQAREHLKSGGVIFLLISSITPLTRIKAFKPKIVARKKLFFEELLILEIR